MKKILVVDDDEQSLSYMETLFKAQGFHVTTAHNGAQALEAARENPPHIIITDILMPVMDGFMLCREWKKDSRLKNIPIVFYTATYTDPKDEKLALDMGLDLFIKKPQEPDILLYLIQKVVAKRKSEKRKTKPETKLSEEALLQKYNETLFRKLEKKIRQLETSNQQLRILEERYRLSFENVFDVIYIIDTDLTILSVSPSVERILGYKPQDFIGRHVPNLGDILKPESLEQITDDISLVLKGETNPAKVYRFIAKDGTNKYVEVSGSPFMREDKIIGIISVARDITERKQAEEELRRSEEKYRSLVENAQEGIYQSTAKGRYLTVNPAFARILGYDSPEEVMATITDIGQQLYVNPDDRKKLIKMVNEKGLVTDFETEHYKKDGSRIWVSVNMHAIRDDQGRILHYQGISQDITKKKKIEAERQENIKRLRKYLRATINAMAVTVETRDPYTAGHQRRVADLAQSIATEMNMASEQIDCVRMASMIHDIGKISIPAEILTKPTKLNELEFNLIKTHSQSGHDSLKDIEYPWPVADIILQHHERMDGSGYPQGLKGDDILLEARILAIADVVESMAFHRPYRSSLGIEAALEEIEKNKGVLYDKAAADACLRLFRKKGYQLK